MTQVCTKSRKAKALESFGEFNPAVGIELSVTLQPRFPPLIEEQDACENI
ncbi:MAG TPA: hypothetical protein VGQ95_12105 [Chthoniobacterales bacterium]|nr:hypothetical protein [Chthoniobacterales bacterium]